MCDYGGSMIPGLRLKQRLLPASVHSRTFHPKVLIRKVRSHPPAWRAIEKANLNEKRLVNLLDRIRLLGERGSQRVHANRTALVLLNDRQQQLAVDLVEPVAIDLQHLESRLRSRFVDAAGTAHLCVITNPTQQPVSDTRCAAAAGRDLHCGGLVD